MEKLSEYDFFIHIFYCSFVRSVLFVNFFFFMLAWRNKKIIRVYGILLLVIWNLVHVLDCASLQITWKKFIFIVSLLSLPLVLFHCLPLLFMLLYIETVSHSTAYTVYKTKAIFCFFFFVCTNNGCIFSFILSFSFLLLLLLYFSFQVASINILKFVSLKRAIAFSPLLIWTYTKSIRIVHNWKTLVQPKSVYVTNNTIKNFGECIENEKKWNQIVANDIVAHVFVYSYE